MNSINLFAGKDPGQLRDLLSQLVGEASKDLATLQQLRCLVPQEATPEALQELFVAVSFLTSSMNTAMEKKRLYFRVHKDAEDTKVVWERKLEEEKYWLLSQHAETTKPMKTKDEKFAFIAQFQDVSLKEQVLVLQGVASQAHTWYGQVCIECERIKRLKDMSALLFKIWMELYGDSHKRTQIHTNDFTDSSGSAIEEESPMMGVPGEGVPEGVFDHLGVELSEESVSF